MSTKSTKAKAGAKQLAKTARKKKAPEVKELIQAPYRFTTEETAHMNIELRARLNDIETLEEQAKAAAQDFKLRVKNLEISAKQLRNKLDSGEETRPIEALVEFDTKRSMKAYHHPVTRDFIREEPMQPADWQLPMFKETNGKLEPATPAKPKAEKPVSQADVSTKAPKGYVLVRDGNTESSDMRFETGKGWIDVAPNEADMPVSSFIAVARKDPSTKAKTKSGNGNLGDAIDRAAQLKDAAKLELDLTDESVPHDKLTANFRKAAKAAQWTEPQIALMKSLLRECDTTEKMRDTLRPHSTPPAK